MKGEDLSVVIAREPAAAELTIELEPGKLYGAGRSSQATLDIGNKKIAIVMSSLATEGAERPVIEVETNPSRPYPNLTL